MLVGKGTINKLEPSFNCSCSMGKETEVSGIIMFIIKGTLRELECKIYRLERGAGTDTKCCVLCSLLRDLCAFQQQD